MNYKVILFFLVFETVLSCSRHTNNKETWKREIVDTEQAFSEMALTEGIAKAFAEFAADDVVINRNDSLILGKSGLIHFYNQASDSNRKIELSWKPDFVDVCSSGDMGYTFGKYLFTASDSTGKTESSSGVFHTVWKRQPDGSWRFVWD